MKHYERVLDMADKAGVCSWADIFFAMNWLTTLQDDLFAREAAYNLSLILVFTGAPALADTLYRRWLSI